MQLTWGLSSVIIPTHKDKKRINYSLHTISNKEYTKILTTTSITLTYFDIDLIFAIDMDIEYMYHSSLLI